jgi:trimeric autotransporter adhesin
MSNLSPSTLALLRAAKNDAPSKESRTAIWGGVTSGLVTHTPLHITPQATSAAGPSTAPIAGTGASAAPQVAAAAKGGLLVGASFTGMKGAFIGALFGSAISIGVATFMMRAKPAEIPHAPLSTQAAAQVSDSARSNTASSPTSANANANTNAQAIDLGGSNALPMTASASKSGSTVNSAGSSVSGSDSKSSTSTTSTINAKSMTDETQSLHSKKSTSTPTSTLSPDDLLSREVSLVTEARRDLLVGDAASALKAARAARALEARQLEPEEMSLEARSLRALGRDAEATKVESQLRTMYPDQTLGR